MFLYSDIDGHSRANRTWQLQSFNTSGSICHSQLLKARKDLA